MVSIETTMQRLHTQSHCSTHCCNWICKECKHALDDFEREQIWSDPEGFCGLCNKIITLIFIILSVAGSFTLVYYFSITYDKVISNVNDYHYTSCIISDIVQNNKSNKFNIDVLYGLSNNDWNITDTVTISNEYSHLYVTDIQTCVYSLNEATNKIVLTIIDYNKYSDSNASYLMTDDKWGLISLIIFWSFFMLFCGLACCVWVFQMSCVYVKYSSSLYYLMGICILIFMIVGWPILIMGAMIEHGINTIPATNIYNQFDCIVNGISSIKFYENVHYSFAIVEYSVFIENDFLIGVDVINDLVEDDFGYLNESHSVYDVITLNQTSVTNLFLKENSMQICYQNIDTNQIILDQYPDTELLQSPFESAVGIIVLGIMAICAPCTLYILYWTGYYCVLIIVAFDCN